MTPLKTHPGRFRPAEVSARPKAVVVHSGARDNYQVARALAERGQLQALVTDLYWPADRVAGSPALARLVGKLPAGVRQQLALRHAAELPAAKISTLFFRGLLTLGLDKLRRAPFRWKRGVMRSTDAALGRKAGRLAARSGAVLLSYSYYGYHAFRRNLAPGLLFQLHPHPASMRAILRAELLRYPECAESLQQEWELALPEEDFRRLVEEPRMAAHILAASSFTRQTLIDHGVRPEAVTVIPYGVDCRRFSPAAARRKPDGTLRLLFVGRINQRKGIRYLLEALRLLNRPDIHLTVCGRAVDGLTLFQGFGERVKVRPSVSEEELLAAYRAADLFVLPSVGEGFGQVLLESLACGLPILSTTHTAAPDLIDEGVQGFVVAPGDVQALAERIGWAADHPDVLLRMRAAARARAEQFSWARFRAGVGEAFEAFSLRHGTAAAEPVGLANAEVLRV